MTYFETEKVPVFRGEKRGGRTRKGKSFVLTLTPSLLIPPHNSSSGTRGGRITKSVCTENGFVAAK